MRIFEKLFGRTQPTASEPVKKPEPFLAVGYPKVGNTWIRLMVGKYLELVYKLPSLPVMELVQVDELAAAGCRGVGSFSHEPLDWQHQTADDLTVDFVMEQFRGRRVIFLTRHPLDTLVSLHMDFHHRAKGFYAKGVSEMVLDPVFGFDKMLKFHQVWAENKDQTADFLLCRYEDTVADPKQQLERILTFIGEPVNDGVVGQAVAFGAFDNLQSLELSGQSPRYKSSQLQVLGPGGVDNRDALHVRRGKIGGYADDLPADTIRLLEQRVANEWPRLFGYN